MANGIKRGPLYAVCQEYQRHGIAAPGPTTNLPIPGRSAPDKASNTVTISNHFDRRQPEEEFRCTAVVRGPVGFRGLIGAKQRDCSNPRPTASAVRFGTQTRGHDKRMNDRYGARDAGSAEHSRPESAGSGRGWARVIWAWARGGALGGMGLAMHRDHPAGAQNRLQCHRTTPKSSIRIHGFCFQSRSERASAFLGRHTPLPHPGHGTASELHPPGQGSPSPARPAGRSVCGGLYGGDPGDQGVPLVPQAQVRGGGGNTCVTGGA